eukprot:TRINITY_DN53957_c0_g1_i1.p1 TRINITY_DN53957_c0_g1~~TRINITY_DN53957_c0_g1_i1.p1  ORF type:complete len:554 (+),score=146.64 TRINITY_DN53957_c0_g1_i1:225-1664(+)
MKMRHRARGYHFHSNGSTASGSAPVSSQDLMVPLVEKKGTTDRQDTNTTQVMVVEGPSNLHGLKAMFLNPLSLLLVSVPLGMLSDRLGWGASCTFWLNFAALVPLAKVLGDATEELSAAIGNDVVSGLLNATFGNAVEMIVSIQAIRAGEFVLVKSSLLGSVLSNVLLVLGMAFFFGGLTPSKTRTGRFHSSQDANFKTHRIAFEKEQKFAVKTALVSMALLFFSCMSFALPTVFDALPSDDSSNVLRVSRIGAVICTSSYLAYLLFQLVTHSATLAKEETDLGSRRSDGEAASPERLEGQQEEDSDDEDFGEEEESASLTVWCSTLIMVIITVVVSISSDYLVSSLKAIVSGGRIPEGFIGVILVPIAGNACEHAAAIRFAIKDRPGLAIGIAVGSSTQVAMFVIPLSVLIAWWMGRPLDLNFGLLNVTVMIMSALVLLTLILDGRSNWLKGYILCCLYMFIAVLYWYAPPLFGSDID